MAGKDLVQVQVYPWQRTLRTLLVTVVTVAPTMLVIVPQIVDTAKGFLPPGEYAQLAAVGAGIVVVATLLTRLLQNPAVDNLLTKLGLGIVPRGSADQNIVVAVKNASAAAAAVRQIEQVAAADGLVPGVAAAQTTTPVSTPPDVTPAPAVPVTPVETPAMTLTADPPSPPRTGD